MSSDAMVFADDALIEVPVTIGQKHYLLKEASGEAAKKWRNSLLKATKMSGRAGDIQVTSVEGIADSESYLVSLCLFDSEGGKPVSLPTILSWPARIVKSLFERAKEISQLDEASPERNGRAEDPKASPPNSTAG